MRAVLKSEIKKTEYFWGNKQEISGEALQVLEKNERGHCMCISPKGLVDVHRDDIERILP